MGFGLEALNHEKIILDHPLSFLIRLPDLSRRGDDWNFREERESRVRE